MKPRPNLHPLDLRRGRPIILSRSYRRARNIKCEHDGVVYSAYDLAWERLTRIFRPFIEFRRHSLSRTEISCFDQEMSLGVFTRPPSRWS